MKNESQVILVTGATGKQGGAVLRHLRAGGFAVRAMVRDPESAAAQALAGKSVTLMRGDYDDPSSLLAALQGVYGAFAVQTFAEPDIAHEVVQGIALADAAKQAGIAHMVYSSVGSADTETGVPHFDSKHAVEAYLRQIGLPVTILRPVFFMQNWEMLRSQIMGGVLAQPLRPNRVLQQLHVDDLGAFARMAFEQPGMWLGRAVDLAGDELTMIGVADTFTRVIGRTVTYQQLPDEQFSQFAGQEVATMYQWLERVGYRADIAARRVEYPALSTLEQYLRTQGWADAPLEKDEVRTRIPQ